MNHKRFLSTLFISLIFIFGSLLIWANKQNIYDWARLRNYVPSSEVAQLASATTMNDYGKRIFYVNRPQVQDKDLFNQNCTESEQTIVLGCYVPVKGIFLYDVNDSQLDGVEEVTAAHEMLHAAYDRLSESERQRIDNLTQAAFESLDDARIKKTVKAYKEKDPSVVPNELHSIIGTEVRNLPPELEEYYAKYFEDRLSIVKYSEKYEAEFTKLESQATSLKGKMDDLKVQIDKINKSLEYESKQLSNEYESLESSRNGANPSVFNARADAYNTRVNEYNNQVKYVGELIDDYNKLLSQYNSIVTQENELIQAIDSRPQTIKSE